MTEWKISKAPVPYEEAVQFMEARAAGIYEGREAELVWLLEHPALYTAGTSAKAGDLLDQKFPVFKTGRGGQYTYHGPGQRIAYVMMDLRRRGKPDVRRYVCDLEAWIIASLKEFGIQGERREGRVGIWVAGPRGESKIAAVGVRIKRWVTLHGISINVYPDLSHYHGIVPCGISDYGVTSMAALGVDAGLEDVDRVLKEKWEEVFQSAANRVSRDCTYAAQ